MTELKIGITGINAMDNPGPGVGIARSLKKDRELNVNIIGLAYNSMEPGIYMNGLIDKAYIMPDPSAGHEHFLKRLYHIKNTYGLDFVIPNLDSELPLYIKHEHELAQNGIRTFLPSAEQFRLRSKDRLVDIAEQMGIKCPESVIVTTIDDLLFALAKLDFPVMIKGSLSKANKAYTTQEALSHYHNISTEYGFPIIVQKAIIGKEMNVVGVGDGEGNSLGMVCIKKLWITSLGKMWNGVTTKNEHILAVASRFLMMTQWKGGFELECLVNGGEVYLIEINPRLPDWSYFATGAGINLPANLLRKALSMPISNNPDYEEGKLFIRYTYELVTNMAPYRAITMNGER